MLQKQRLLFAAQFVACFLIIAIALGLQHGLDLTPCPLCITQRLLFMVLGLFAATAGWHQVSRRGQLFYHGLLSSIALLGAGVALRHVWLQMHAPAEAVSCGPGLAYLIKILPASEVIKALFNGTGDCAIVQFKFLGITTPGWSLLAFIGFIAINLYGLCHNCRSTNPLK